MICLCDINILSLRLSSFFAYAKKCVHLIRSKASAFSSRQDFLAAIVERSPRRSCVVVIIDLLSMTEDRPLDAEVPFSDYLICMHF